MPSLPSFQFYPADWRNDLALRACSPAARGFWIDIICLLHTAEEYGIFRMRLTALATACGAPIELLEELAAANVLKGSDTGMLEPFCYRPRHARAFGEPIQLIAAGNKPVWFCARMVIDEHKRTRTGEGTRFTSLNNPNKRPIVAPTGREGDGSTDAKGDAGGDGSSASSSASVIHTSAAAAGPSLSGIKLTWKEQAASDLIFTAASDAMRPKGSAGKNWVLPLHAAERISAAIDSMLKAGPAVIDGSEQHPCEFAGEISAVVRGANPAGLGPFCNFIVSIWDRCQRNGCKPGDPHKSNPLKIERQKPNDAAETDTAMAAIAAEIEKQELRRARR